MEYEVQNQHPKETETNWNVVILQQQVCRRTQENKKYLTPNASWAKQIWRNICELEKEFSNILEGFRITFQQDKCINEVAFLHLLLKQKITLSFQNFEKIYINRVFGHFNTKYVYIFANKIAQKVKLQPEQVRRTKWRIFDQI